MFARPTSSPLRCIATTTSCPLLGEAARRHGQSHEFRARLDHDFGEACVLAEQHVGNGIIGLRNGIEQFRFRKSGQGFRISAQDKDVASREGPRLRTTRRRSRNRDQAYASRGVERVARRAQKRRAIPEAEEPAAFADSILPRKRAGVLSQVRRQIGGLAIRQEPAPHGRHEQHGAGQQRNADPGKLEESRSRHSRHQRPHRTPERSSPYP